MGDWYYIGHYGQLGPLTREQIDELISGGVIGRETYVWRTGMVDWLAADRCTDLADTFRLASPHATPPPQPTTLPVAVATSYASLATYDYTLRQSTPVQPAFSGLRSDRSRTAAGILQIFLPGVGRMYLGYLAYGVIQLALTFVTCGFLWLWSVIDGIIILSGGVKLDGYGRQIPD